MTLPGTTALHTSITSPDSSTKATSIRYPMPQVWIEAHLTRATGAASACVPNSPRKRSRGPMSALNSSVS